MDGGKHTMITYIKRKQNGYINFIKNKLQVRKIIRDKEGYYIMIKRFILKDYIAILKICLTKNRIKLHEAKADRTTRRNSEITEKGKYHMISLICRIYKK